jgi:uncharacterized DUF497 family protein
VDARLLFDGRPVISYRSLRGDEMRFVTIGQIGLKFYAVVWVERADATRLISFRRARGAEEQAYHATFG